MSIPMSQIPDSLLVPGQYQEIDNALSGSLSDVKRVLVVGLKTAAGSAEAGKAVAVSGEARARALLGAGSPAALMAAAFLELNTVEELYALPLAENPAGVAAVKKLTFTVVNPKAGTLTRYIAGQAVQIATEAADTAATIAARFVAAVNAIVDMPFEAAVNGVNTNEVDLTALVRGEIGNNYDIGAGLYGETDPSGVTVAVSTTTPGSGNPSVAASLAALGGVRYHYLVTDFSDAANLAAFASELEDRYSALRQIGGRLFVALSGDVGDASTAGTMIYQAEALNCPHLVLVARGNNHQAPGEWASRLAAVAVRALADDPAANTQGAAIDGLVATESYDAATREKLLEAGIATWREDAAGGVVIERLVTSYTENDEGSRDTSYLDIQVVETVDAIRTAINSAAAKRFKAWKLASTEENFGSGSRVMTPSIWRAFLVEMYQKVFIEESQWCQDLESYKNSILVEIASGSKTRLNYRHQPVLIGQFLIGAGVNQFK